MTTIKVPIPTGGENNLESLFLKAQSGDPQDIRAYEEKLAQKLAEKKR